MGASTKEIGGYFELERFEGNEYHGGALALNCARACLSYLIEARSIERIWTPWFLCESIDGACRRAGVHIEHFEVKKNFEPDYATIDLKEGDYLYLVDYYGQLTDEAIGNAALFCNGRIIVDEVMAFFRKPFDGLDTIYSCRKFFGVSDGAYLYTDARIRRELPVDESHDKMGFVLARCERPANERYPESAQNNKRFIEEPVKQMSPITHNILRAIDYDAVGKKRQANFEHLAHALDGLNEIRPHSTFGAFMYPLLIENGPELRRELQGQKIYVSMLWGRNPQPTGISGRLAKDILPIICDQRYGTDEMDIEIAAVKALIARQA